jgi:protein-S-isoprenylcysteine O-methyltransferase Ste14
MRASAFEFRFRLWISFAIIVVGFWAPWIELLHWDSRGNHAWGWLVFELGGIRISATTGFALVTSLAIAAAALGAVLRVWGTAYLGTGTVFNAQMKAGDVLADGPYRYMRNPLYLGSFLDIVAIAILMPPSGAAVSLVLLAIFLLRLILGEEAFLAPKLGETYAAYCKAVPRLIPSPRPRVAAGGRIPNWGRALLGEVFPLCLLVSFATLSWEYDANLLTRAVLICFGVSLVTRALLPSGTEQRPAA